MVDLPHRFVPTTSKFVSPVRIVTQCGHGCRIVSVAFSPCSRFFASADEDGWVRIWSIETLDILGIYLLDFECGKLIWDATDAVVCQGQNAERRIEFMELEESAAKCGIDSDASGNVIRLLGAPEFEHEGDILKILYGGDVFEHQIPGLFQVEMDPCERYIVALSPQAASVFSVFDGSLIMEQKASDNHRWCAAHIYWRGDFFTILEDDGAIWQGYPANQKIECVLKGNAPVTAWDLSGKSLIIYGDCRGNLTIFDLEQRTLCLRTPRRPRDFCAVYPSPEKVGFVALRTESATAFFSHSQEILSAAPLPGSVRASCAGTLFSEVIAACSDGSIYRLKLDENAISKICTFDRPVDVMASSSNCLLVHYEDGGLAINSGKTLELLDWHVDGCKALAVSENGKSFACLLSDHIEIFDRTGKTDIRRIEIQDAVQIAFGKDKTANQLLAFMKDLRVISIDLRTGECSELNRLDLEHGRIISVAPAAKSYVFVLAASEHGQLVVLKVGLNSAKSSQVLRIFAVGTQIWGAASNEQSVCLRNDASCLRIISGLKAFSIDDWSRSEPLALF